jgi:hypothetical protein
MLAVLFGPAIARGYFWAPGDGITQNFPLRVLVGAAWRAGEIPFWNPFVFGGMPLMATIHPGVFFLGNAPFGCLGPITAMNLTLVLAYALAMAGMGQFARALALPPLAAFTSALVFGAGGFMLMHEQHVQMVQAAALAPWLLWTIERYALSARTRYAWATAGVVLLMVLAGHPQMMAYGGLLALAYTLWRTPALAVENRLPFLLTAGLALIGGIGLAAFQLWPTLDLIHASQRQAIDFNWLARGSVPPQGLGLWLFPFAYGSWNPSPVLPVGMWGHREWFNALDGYVGIVPLLLAGVALGTWRTERAVRFWSVVAVLGATLSLGHFTPVYRLWALLPVVNQMPYANRHGFELTFALAVLAGYGMAALETEHGVRQARRVALGLGTLCALALVVLVVKAPGFALRTQPLLLRAAGALTDVDLLAALRPWQTAFWLPPVWLLLAYISCRKQGLRVLLPLLLAVDLWSVHWHHGMQFVLPSAREALELNPHLDWTAGRSLALSVRRYPNCYHCDIFAYLQHWHYPDVTVLTAEPTINGYDAFVPARYGQIFGMDSFGHVGELSPAVWQAPHHALDLLGLHTLRLEGELVEHADWRARLASGRWQRQGDEGDLKVYTNKTALPHAWRVASARLLAPQDVDAAVGGRAPFVPIDEALVEEALPRSAFARGTATATSPSLNRMRLVTQGAGPGLVVLGSGYDAGWRAFLAGTHEELPLRRVDALLLGVVVPAGPQTVDLVYEPLHWRAGLAVSVLSLVLLLGLALPWRRRGPQPSPAF